MPCERGGTRWAPAALEGRAAGTGGLAVEGPGQCESVDVNCRRGLTGLSASPFQVCLEATVEAALGDKNQPASSL